MSNFFICMKAFIPRRFSCVSVHQHFEQRDRHHLPGEAEFVLEPAARAFLAARRQLAPEMIDLGLAVAIDLERDRLVELEMRSAVQRHEALACELEPHAHHRACFLAVDLPAFIGIVGYGVDLGVLENGGVKLRGLLGLGIEPQARSVFCVTICMGLLLSFKPRSCVPNGKKTPMLACPHIRHGAAPTPFQGSSASSRPLGTRSRKL